MHALVTSRPPDILEEAEERDGPQERGETLLRRLSVSWIQSLMKEEGPVLQNLGPSNKTFTTFPILLLNTKNIP